MKTRLEKCLELRIKGMTYESVAQQLSISKQRVHQILTGYKSPSSLNSKKTYKIRHRATDIGKEKNCEYVRRNRWKIKVMVLSHYSNMKAPSCVYCGFTDIRALSIDHIDGGGTRHKAILKVGSSFYKWLIAHDYPEGYQTLCMNCQFIKRVANNELSKNKKFCSNVDNASQGGLDKTYRWVYTIISKIERRSRNDKRTRDNELGKSSWPRERAKAQAIR